MNAMLRLALAGALAVAMLFSNAHAQSSALQKQLIGTWTLVSFDTVTADGAKRPGVEGSNPKGLLIFGRDGRFSQQVIADLPKFGVDRLKTTPQEDSAVARGILSYYGTYTVNDKALVFHIERSSYPNQNGTDQKRDISKLTANELTITLTRMKGGQNTVAWKRAK